jgi:putative endonuclease
MIRCADNSIYTGITIDLERRFAEHQSQGKKCAKYLKGKSPLELSFSIEAGTKSDASCLELRIKGCTKAIKERLIAGQTTLEELGLRSAPPAPSSEFSIGD